MRSLGSPRVECSGVLEEEIRGWTGLLMQEERTNSPPPQHSLVLVARNVFIFKPGTDDHTTNNSV